MLGTSLHGERCVHICEIYAVKYVQKIINKRLLNLSSWQMLRILCYLPVHCAKGAEFAAFAVCFLDFSGWTPSLVVVVRIQ